jgi:uncharacterized protein (DUF169 family)
MNLRRARQIERHIRPLTLPIGVRFWKKGEQIPPEAGSPPDRTHSWCQFLTLAATNASDNRPTFLVRENDFACPIAPGMLGFRERMEDILSGGHVEQIHFETKELAKSSMDTLPSVPPHTVEAATVAALENLDVEPDVIVVKVSPGMVNRIMDASLWYTGGPYTTSYGSISGICASATAKAYIDQERVSHIAFPCMGSRRWGGWTDNELALSVNIKQFATFIKGLENTWLTGHSYPIGLHLVSQCVESHHQKPAKDYSEVYPYCYEH